MSAKRNTMVSGAVLLALTASVSAGPMNVTQSKLIAAPQVQTELVYYRYYHRHVGLAELPFAMTTGGWPYYEGYYGSPIYGPYAYYAGPYGYYVGRSVGYSHLHGGAHK
jgi:hypothetical protein